MYQTLICVIFADGSAMKTEFKLSKHRFYELKHFCLQYPEWKRLYSQMDGWSEEIGKNEGDTTSRDGIRRGDIRRNVETIEKCARIVGNDILRFVTDGRISVPPDKMYDYRRFFWELSRRKS